MIFIIIFGNELLKLFYDKLGMPYIKLNINEQKNMLLWLHFANRLIIYY